MNLPSHMISIDIKQKDMGPSTQFAYLSFYLVQGSSSRNDPTHTLSASFIQLSLGNYSRHAQRLLSESILDCKQGDNINYHIFEKLPSNTLDLFNTVAM